MERKRRPRACAAAVHGVLLAVLATGAAAQDVPPEDRSPGQGTPFARFFRPGSNDVLVARAAAPKRRLRGDFEPIDLLVIVHNAQWEPALRVMTEHAATRVPVQVLVPERRRAAAWLRAPRAKGCVSVQEARFDTPWIRDYGPVQVVDGEQVTWLDYAYYPGREQDDAFPLHMAGRFRVPVEREAAHLDGGALLSNGRGLCAMTDASLQDAGVPPHDRAALEAFVTRMGCRALAVLPALAGEQTGHADVIAQFLTPELVAVASMDAALAPGNALRLDLAVGALRRAARALGLPLRVARIPMHAAGNVFYSYLNATRVRDLLFVPDYAAVDPALQADAHARLGAALPGVALVPVPADGMVPLGGAIHCVTLGLHVRDAAAPCAAPPASAEAAAMHEHGSL